jgi:ADP-heptose:LPS heptosyltransferase
MRSLPLKQFTVILAARDATFFSLQRQCPEPDQCTLDELPRLNKAPDALDDFAATAAFVSQLDLVICVDTSVAHLAGALGVPVWILLPFAPDWRWQLARSDSPWYPTARLYRQPALDDWSPVLSQVAHDLADFVRTRHDHQTS